MFINKINEKVVSILLYVDDLIITGDAVNEIQMVRENLSVRFLMKDLGELNHFLGLEVERNAKGLFISQKKYAEDLLKKFGMQNCKSIATPMEVNQKLRAEDGDELEDTRLYRRLVGS